MSKQSRRSQLYGVSQVFAWQAKGTLQGVWVDTPVEATCAVDAHAKAEPLGKMKSWGFYKPGTKHDFQKFLRTVDVYKAEVKHSPLSRPLWVGFKVAAGGGCCCLGGRA